MQKGTDVGRKQIVNKEVNYRGKYRKIKDETQFRDMQGKYRKKIQVQRKIEEMRHITEKCKESMHKC